MGVVNVTPDSFSDGGKFLDPGLAIERALQLLDEGADILDIGGESTRPGARIAADEPGGTVATRVAVTEEEELRRVMPVIEGVLRARPGAVVSVDTYKSGVARAAVAAGAEIVNDVSAFQWDPEMACTCAELQCGVVLMHTRGQPHQWRDLPGEVDIVARVVHELANRVQVAFERGVRRERIVLDPGFGFGKNFEENYPLAGALRPVAPDGISAAGRDFAQVICWTHSWRARRQRCAPHRAPLWIAGGDGSEHSRRSPRRARS